MSRAPTSSARSGVSHRLTTSPSVSSSPAAISSRISGNASFPSMAHRLSTRFRLSRSSRSPLDYVIGRTSRAGIPRSETMLRDRDREHRTWPWRPERIRLDSPPARIGRRRCHGRDARSRWGDSPADVRAAGRRCGPSRPGGRESGDPAGGRRSVRRGGGLGHGIAPAETGRCRGHERAGRGGLAAGARRRGRGDLSTRRSAPARRLPDAHEPGTRADGAAADGRGGRMLPGGPAHRAGVCPRAA